MRSTLLMAWAGVLFLLGLSSGFAAEKAGAGRYEEVIKAFEAQDREKPPAPGGILFVGSSTIRMWDLGKWFPTVEAINRGFGGSMISEVNDYADRVIFRYAPRIIVFYAGDNDIAHGKGAETVFSDFQGLLKRIHEKLPQTLFVALPIKPSIARWPLWPQMNEVNERVRQLAEKDDLLVYVDTAAPMLDAEGHPRRDYLLEDGLHLNEQGYAVWSGLLKPYVTGKKKEVR